MIEGFYEDNNIESLDEARTFVKNDDEDCWVEIIPISQANMCVVQTYENCQRTKTALVPCDDKMWKNINSYVKATIKQ